MIISTEVVLKAHHFEMPCLWIFCSISESGEVAEVEMEPVMPEQPPQPQAASNGLGPMETDKAPAGQQEQPPQPLTGSNGSGGSPKVNHVGLKTGHVLRDLLVDDLLNSLCALLYAEVCW